MHNVVTGTASNPARWRAADLEIDVGLQRVERNGACIELPRLSFELLLALLRGAPQTTGMRSGFVRLKPGESIGAH